MTGGPFGPQAPLPPPQPPRSGPNPGLIVGLVLLLVGAVAGGALLLTSGDDDEDTENASNRRGQEPCAQELRQQDGGDGQGEVPGGLPGAEGGEGGEGGLPGACGAPEPPEMPDVEVPPPSGDVDVSDSGDVEIELPETPEVPDLSDIPVPDAATDLPSTDAVSALADSIYESTPASIDEGTATCIAEVITSVVGEDAVIAAGADYQILYASTTSSEDGAISSGIYSTCTTVEQDADLASDPDWPGPWAPA